MTVEDTEQEIKRGLRRAREADEQEEIDEELSGRLRTSMVGLVEVAGPPWHDSRTGAVLDPLKVEIGMDRERGSMKKFAVMERAADQDEPIRLGRTPISTGWVLSDRGAAVKARLVARQVN